MATVRSSVVILRAEESCGNIEQEGDMFTSSFPMDYPACCVESRLER